MAIGFSGYQPLIRTYIGEGLRNDLERLQQSPAQLLVDSLRRHGLSHDAISEIVTEAQLKSA